MDITVSSGYFDRIKVDLALSVLYSLKGNRVLKINMLCNRLESVALFSFFYIKHFHIKIYKSQSPDTV